MICPFFSPYPNAAMTTHRVPYKEDRRVANRHDGSSAWDGRREQVGGFGGGVVGGWSKKEKIMDTDNTVVIAGRRGVGRGQGGHGG